MQPLAKNRQSQPAIERRRAAVDRQTRSHMLDMLIMMVPLAIMAVVNYGARPLAIMALSVLSAVVMERIGYALMRRPSELGDFSAVFTGMAIALVMPASAPLWLPVAGVAFAIIVAKLPFGSASRAPLIPAAAGIAFLTVCWGDLFFTYPVVSTSVAVTGSESFRQGYPWPQCCGSGIPVHRRCSTSLISSPAGWPAPWEQPVPSRFSGLRFISLSGTRIALLRLPHLSLPVPCAPSCSRA